MTVTLRDGLLGAYRLALSRAIPPTERVARHWEPPVHLTWLALVTAGDGFHLSMSFGRLIGRLGGEGPDTTGVFLLSGKVFPGIDEGALQRELRAAVPTADGPTTVFLQRVVAQLTVADVALELEAARTMLGMPVAPEFRVVVAQRPDALNKAATTPRLKAHTRPRVLDAVTRMEPTVAERLRKLFVAPEPELLEAVRGFTVKTRN